MKYYFTWNSETIIEEQVKIWKDRFVSKFGDFNCININSLEELNNNYIIETLTWWSFLSEKKLIILKLSWNKSEDEKITFIISIFDKIPEDNILLIREHKPDKRSKNYKFFVDNTKHTEYSILNPEHLKRTIQEKYNNKISSEAINKIIAYKAQNLAKIYQELEKLLITKDYINSEDIIQNIIPELEESIFQIIDSLLNLEKNILLNKIDILLNQTNIYAFYNNFISNIRTNLYILKYKNLKISSKDITSKLNLWSRAFLVNKNYKITFKQLKDFYIWLINIDKKMKTWKLFQADDDVFKLEIERLVMKL